MPIVNGPPGLRQIKMYDGTVHPGGPEQAGA